MLADTLEKKAEEVNRLNLPPRDLPELCLSVSPPEGDGWQFVADLQDGQMMSLWARPCQ